LPSRGVEGQKLTRELYTTLQVGVVDFTQLAVEVVVCHKCEDVPYRSTRTNGRPQPSKTYHNNAANMTTTGTDMGVEARTLHAASDAKEIVN
jgi:hypothetical protein